MPARVSFARPAALVLALACVGCAGTTPPPRFSAVSPADPEAPEAATPPAAPVLTGGPDAAPTPRPSPGPTPTPHHHGGHS